MSFRPHVKTNKSIEVTRRMLPGGAGRSPSPRCWRRTISPRHGFKDILYAVCIAPNKLAHVAALQEQGVRLSLILDSMETARFAGARARTRSRGASTC